MTSTGGGHALSGLKAGDHVAWLYQNDEEHRRTVAMFVREGLDQGERVIYLHDNNSAEAIVGCLRDRGATPAPAQGIGPRQQAEVSACLARRQFRLLEAGRVYAPDGIFDARRMTAFVAAETERALSDGYRALRITGEMTWALRVAGAREQLGEYEYGLNDVIPGSRCLAVCQYDRRCFGQADLSGVTCRHPIVLIGPELYDNPYYTPRVATGDAHGATRLRDVFDALDAGRKATDTLEKNRRFQESLFASIQDGISVLDSDMNIVRVNPVMERWYAHAIPLAGRKCHEAYHGRRRPCAVCPTRRALRTGQPCHNEVPKRGQDGQIGWLDLYALPLVDDKTGAVTGVIEYVRDITDRRRAEARMNEAGMTLEALAGACPLPIVATNRDGLVTKWNPAAETVFGWAADEVLGRPLPIVPGDAIHGRCELRENALRGESARSVDARRLHKNGTLLDVSISTAPLHDADGRISGTMAIISDISTRKRMEEERRRMDERIAMAQRIQSLAVLAGGLAHDYNNLLVSILGNVELALMDCGPESSLRSTLTDIRTAALQASDLTRNMLAFGRTDPPEKSATVDLNELTRETVRLLRPMLPRGAVLTLSLADGLPRVRGNATELRQVLMNLLINARDALCDGRGYIAVRSWAESPSADVLSDVGTGPALPPGDYVCLEVSDTGLGMSEETQKRLFEPFFTTKEMGRGLGLAAVHGIVRNHGGGISVRSRLGKGSRFRLMFPRASDAVSPNES